MARAGLNAVLHEMRPLKQTPAHKTGHMAGLVCSNSLKSESENSAPRLLKEELRKLDSLAMRIAQQTRVPAGHALTVDRDPGGTATPSATGMATRSSSKPLASPTTSGSTSKAAPSPNRAE